MADENEIYQLIEDSETLLCDLFLSGFNNVAASSLTKISCLKNDMSEFGMEKGSQCMEKLENELNNRKKSFNYDIGNITEAYCNLDFYLKTAKEQLR